MSLETENPSTESPPRHKAKSSRQPPFRMLWGFVPVALLIGTFAGMWFQRQNPQPVVSPIFTIVYGNESGPDVSQVANFTLTDCAVPADEDLEGSDWDAALADLAQEYPGEFGFHGADADGYLTITYDLLQSKGASSQVRQIGQAAHKAVHRHDLCDT